MLLELLRERYSVRNFSNKKIPDDIINYILECGRLSPSGGNEQPWKFGVITDSDMIKKIAAETYYNKSWLEKAPLLIVLCTQLFPDFSKDELTSKRFPSLIQEIKADGELFVKLDMEENQIKIPGTHMVLAALEHGIGSTWVSFVNCEKVGEMLGIEGYLVSNILAFGYPLNKGKFKSKKALDEIVFYHNK